MSQNTALFNVDNYIFKIRHFSIAFSKCCALLQTSDFSRQFFQNLNSDNNKKKRAIQPFLTIPLSYHTNSSL